MIVGLQLYCVNIEVRSKFVTLICPHLTLTFPSVSFGSFDVNPTASICFYISDLRTFYQMSKKNLQLQRVERSDVRLI